MNDFMCVGRALRVLGLPAALALACSLVALASSGAPVSQVAFNPPLTLRETGLYADWERFETAEGIFSFSPQYPLWTDGASKRRFIAIPPGTAVDASDADAWRFPVGTRIWKEFSFGRRVETRYMVLGPDGWRYATYLWSEDEREAVLADPRGGDIAVDTSTGAPHAVPSTSDCVACHGNGETPVLGFSLLQLSPDRDPGALHSVQRAEDVDLGELVRIGALVNLSARFLARPPRIAGRTPTERAALGYLHGNCGHCHRASGALSPLGMQLAHEGAALPEPALTTTINRTSGFALPGAPHAPARRVDPGHPEASVVLARMSARDPLTQMPPIGTHVVDGEAVRLVADWIRELPPSRQLENEP
uniref:hypothetical protein n=1 Tax=Sandaracinus sp. TaxID=2024858 RepID=UPI001FD39069|nr:hypothetical protein [Sandaracinus sp.]